MRRDKFPAAGQATGQFTSGLPLQVSGLRLWGCKDGRTRQCSWVLKGGPRDTTKVGGDNAADVVKTAYRRGRCGYIGRSGHLPDPEVTPLYQVATTLSQPPLDLLTGGLLGATLDILYGPAGVKPGWRSSEPTYPSIRCALP